MKPIKLLKRRLEDIKLLWRDAKNRGLDSEANKLMIVKLEYERDINILERS